jgi:hypothetical protein
MAVLRVGVYGEGGDEQTETEHGNDWAGPKHIVSSEAVVCAEIWRKEYHIVLFVKPIHEEKDHDFPSAQFVSYL